MTAMDVEKSVGENSTASSVSNHSDSILNKDPYEVQLAPEDNPKNLPCWRKWASVLIICGGAVCVTGSSSVAAFAETALDAKWHVSSEVTTLGISLFVLSIGVGPLLVGALVGLFGQQKIYRASVFFLFVFIFPVVFSDSIAVYMIFRFLGGLSGSVFLGIGGGTITDMFSPDDVSTPMAMYTVSTFFGPNFSPLFSGWIAEKTEWKWLYYVLIIWTFAQLVATFIIPETFEPELLRRKANRLRKETGDSRWFAASERNKPNPLIVMKTGALEIIQLVVYDQMVLLLDLWCAVILGIIYLAFQAFPIIFVEHHGFTPGQLGLTFLGVDIGLAIALVSQPFWNKYTKKVMDQHKCHPPPEAWLRMGQWGAIICPIGLYILAFTTFPGVHWIGPIIGTIPFGVGVCWVYTSVFTYLVTAFRPMAAAAMSGNTIIRASFAAGFPLFTVALYHTLGTVGSSALLAGLMTVMAPLPFIFEKVGARLRAKSRFATQDK